MISENEIKDKIDKAEETLQRSFDRLLVFKTGTGDVEDAFLNFQPELAESLYTLMLFYRKIKQEEKDTIGKKAILSPAEFRNTMAQLHEYAEMIKEVIEIGKSLGDAFAWVFYRDNTPELEKHFQHESTGLFVSGLGGRGEVEFVKNQQMFNGMFVVYHGITTMLRVGDFSLYVPGIGIVGIGEIKTTPVETPDGNRMEVQVYISSRINFEALKDIPDAEQTIPITPNFSVDKPHLQTQLSKQDKVLIKQKADKTLSQYGGFEFELIDQVGRSGAYCFNGDHSLLVFGVWDKGDKLYDVLANHDKPEYSPGDVQLAVNDMLLPGFDYNRIIIGHIGTEMTMSRIPLFWWHVDYSVCRDIYFRKILIATVFNPAKLFKHYLDRGYVIEELPKHNYRLIKSNEKERSELHHFEFYFDLISHSLLKTKYVTDMIDHGITEIRSVYHGDYAKIDFHIQLRNFGGSPEA